MVTLKKGAECIRFKVYEKSLTFFFFQKVAHVGETLAFSSHYSVILYNEYTKGID